MPPFRLDLSEHVADFARAGAADREATRRRRVVPADPLRHRQALMRPDAWRPPEPDPAVAAPAAASGPPAAEWPAGSWRAQAFDATVTHAEDVQQNPPPMIKSMTDPVMLVLKALLTMTLLDAKDSSEWTKGIQRHFEQYGLGPVPWIPVPPVPFASPPPRAEQ